MRKRESAKARRASGVLALALPLILLSPAGRGGETLSDPPREEMGACVVAPTLRIPDPLEIALAPTANANGASGSARLAFAMSPFGVAVTADGHHLYRIRLAAAGLPPAGGGAYVAWAVTPSLDRTRKLGVLDSAGEVVSEIAFNKFLVFVTAEPSAGVEKWSGPILLRGISRSGRMHTMAGHGPFQGEPC